MSDLENCCTFFLICKQQRAIDVVCSGLNIQSYPNERAVELVERQIVQQWAKRLEDEDLPEE